MRVTVTGVEEPPIVTGPTDVEFPEDSTGVVATYLGVDPEGAYEVDFEVEGDDGEFFNIEDSGELTSKQRPNYESTDDANEDNVYEVVVVGYDAIRSTTLNVLVRPTDVDEAPEVAGPAHVPLVENGTKFVGAYTKADPEGQPATWESRSGPDWADFEFDETTGELSLLNVPDFDAPTDANGDNVYNVTLRSSDGTYTGTFDVKVTVHPRRRAAHDHRTGQPRVRRERHGTGRNVLRHRPRGRHRRPLPLRPRRRQVQLHQRRPELPWPSQLRGPGRRGPQQRLPGHRRGQGRVQHRNPGRHRVRRGRERGAHGQRAGQREPRRERHGRRRALHVQRPGRGRHDHLGRPGKGQQLLHHRHQRRGQVRLDTQL